MRWSGSSTLDGGDPDVEAHRPLARRRGRVPPDHRRVRRPRGFTQPCRVYRGQRTRVAPSSTPGDFGPVVDNPWYPLIPGTVLRYRGVKDGKKTTETFEVTQQRPVIAGVPCVEVRDTVRLGGRLDERTSDWFAQDLAGNVWYFGEDTATYDAQGQVVSRDGTWRAGVDGAAPGIFMPADPTVGQSFQQESLPGQAEDHFVVTQDRCPRRGAVRVVSRRPADPRVDAARTRRRIAEGLRPGHRRGLRGRSAGSDERLELVRVQRP